MERYATTALINASISKFRNPDKATLFVSSCNAGAVATDIVNSKQNFESIQKGGQRIFLLSGAKHSTPICADFMSTFIRRNLSPPPENITDAERLEAYLDYPDTLVWFENGEWHKISSIKYDTEKEQFYRFYSTLVFDKVANEYKWPSQESRQRIILQEKYLNNKKWLGEVLFMATGKKFKKNSQSANKRHQLVEALLAYKADTSFIASISLSAFTNCLDQKEKELAEIIFKAELEQKIKSTSLHLLADSGNNKLIKMALELPAVKKHVNKKDSDGKTPLLFACDATDNNPDVTAAETLLENGADPDISEERKMTPLMWSCIQGNAHFVELLLKYHANPNLKDDEDRSALFYAARGHTNAKNNNKELLIFNNIVIQLLQSGADPSEIDDSKSIQFPDKKRTFEQIKKAWEKQEEAVKIIKECLAACEVTVTNINTNIGFPTQGLQIELHHIQHVVAQHVYHTENEDERFNIQEKEPEELAKELAEELAPHIKDKNSKNLDEKSREKLIEKLTDSFSRNTKRTSKHREDSPTHFKNIYDKIALARKIMHSR